jgi:hypothetical protein
MQPFFILSQPQSSWSLCTPGRKEIVVRIGVLGAVNLPKMDLVGTCNAYVKVEVRRTPDIYGCMHMVMYMAHVYM